MRKETLLLEIGTEEMPPNALPILAEAFSKSVLQGLNAFQIEHGKTTVFATPRRLALLVEMTTAQQPEQLFEKKGPKLSACYDANGNLTKAAEGFLSSLSITAKYCEQNEHLVYKKILPGKPLFECLDSILKTANDALPIPKRMQWSNLTTTFVRPVHWFVAMYGNQVLSLSFLGLPANRLTYGHRFHHPSPKTLENAQDYPTALSECHVVGEWQKRQEKIVSDIQKLARTLEGEAVISDDVLNEVTGLVEFPVVYAGTFDPAFLSLPKACLLSTMQKHQRYFPVCDKKGELQPHFIFVSNTDSKTPETIIAGNERVLTARLSDASFFYHQDLKTPLEAYFPKLDNVVFQQKLGSLGDKVRRISQLVLSISEVVGADKHLASAAAQLCKCDLLTHMVYEFPELQGIMGHRYALVQKIPAVVAAAIEYHYYPRFANDLLPPEGVSQTLSLADKLDTLVGIFGIGLEPTGNKDPFALRRLALGLARIILEKGISINLSSVLDAAAQGYSIPLMPNTTKRVHTFVLERLQNYWVERGFSIEMIQSVLQVQNQDLLDAQYRLEALKNFLSLSDAANLIAANKRVFNLLKKQSLLTLTHDNCDPNPAFFEIDAEKQLFQMLEHRRQEITALLPQKQYGNILSALASLRETIDTFFEKVMVMAEDPTLQKNRLLLLVALRQLFCQVTDFALL